MVNSHKDNIIMENLLFCLQIFSNVTLASFIVFAVVISWDWEKKHRFIARYPTWLSVTVSFMGFLGGVWNGAIYFLLLMNFMGWGTLDSFPALMISTGLLIWLGIHAEKKDNIAKAKYEVRWKKIIEDEEVLLLNMNEQSLNDRLKKVKEDIQKADAFVFGRLGFQSPVHLVEKNAWKKLEESINRQLNRV